MSSKRTLLCTTALAMAAAGALLTTSASKAHAELVCDSTASLCAKSESCLPVLVGYRCTTTYVYYRTPE